MDGNLSLLKNWFSDKQFYTKSILSDGKSLRKNSEQKALALFQRAAVEVPAYKDFLKKNKIVVSSIKTAADLKNIPLTTKENYIQEYDIEKRCFGGTIANSLMISTSSGTTGKPHLWPRDLQTEVDGAYLHEYILTTYFDISHKKTLLINGFAMGNWIAGTFTLACCNLLALKGYPLVIMTPGYSLEGVMETVTAVTGKFEQIIITGHTPFLKEVAEALNGEKKMENEKIYFLGTGQAITENWRNYVKKLLHNDEHNAIINLYGSADAALMGFETLESIHIRRSVMSNDKIIKKLFDEERLPSLYNYDPHMIYFETANKELVVTKYSSCPLIRYNLYDEGGIIWPEQIRVILNKNSDNIRLSNSLPFVFLFGRDKFLVKLYGANIYSEHIQTAFTHTDVQPYITGRYTTAIEEDKNNNQVLVCKLELNKGTAATKMLEELLKQTFITEIKKLNSEYHYILENMGERVHPQIRLYENGDPTLFPSGKVKKNA